MFLDQYLGLKSLLVYGEEETCSFQSQCGDLEVNCPLLVSAGVSGPEDATIKFTRQIFHFQLTLW